VFEVKSSVHPSAGAAATAAVPMLPVPPIRFSTTNVPPKTRAKCSASSRA